jgi:hypothetical protein
MTGRRVARAFAAPCWLRVLCAAALWMCLAGAARSEDYAVVGQCRAGAPNGEYELWDFQARLRVVGAFSQGRKTGTFIFWTAAGARIAVIPYDADARSGTVALWYAAPDGRVEAGRKLEAPYVGDRLHGVVRSWHPNGAARAEYRYERGELIEARAWSEAGAALPETDARNLALRDADADRGVLETLLGLVGAHLPRCE